MLIEWGDAIMPMLPADYLELGFSFGEGDDDREIVLNLVGDRWVARSEAVSALAAGIGS